MRYILFILVLFMATSLLSEASLAQSASLEDTLPL
ncbi:hypothetical protein SAMN06265222_102458 [Neorhodopirellula lusitana]|uniref:Uncharacterized protein n=1 Tax=Neorhodopirellula lusitana TaxID=445327 RepID=A0ABY1PY87_9BACT|nr:hypothetical protein SAMN06265222_102458 [Neorhodopirellula lusitana]